MLSQRAWLEVAGARDPIEIENGPGGSSSLSGSRLR